MSSTGENLKRIICFILEVIMAAHIFTYSLLLDGPDRSESKASFDAAPAQQLVLANASGSSKLSFESFSKVQLFATEICNLKIGVPLSSIATSEDTNFTASLRNPFYAYTTINAP